jgi:hypothetical protein
MSGDNLSFDPTAQFMPPDRNSAKAPDFGIDLSKPHAQFMAQIQSQTFRPPLEGAEHVFRVPDNVPVHPITIINEGPIAAISLPRGWTEVVPPAPKPGTFVFSVKDGQTFVPPDLSPNVKMHAGPGLQSVSAQAVSALRQVMQAKPATTGPQDLTADEFKSLAGIIGGFDGGSNQYHPLGTLFPKFHVTRVATVNINGRTALLVNGKFCNGTASGGLSRESIYIDNPASGSIYQL